MASNWIKASAGSSTTPGRSSLVAWHEINSRGPRRSVLIIVKYTRPGKASYQGALGVALLDFTL